MNKSKSAFTIVELLIVVVVIGILAAIVIVGYGAVMGNARDKTVLSDSREINGTEAQYAFENNNGGLAWYSTLAGSTNSTLKFTPSPGNIVDIVTNSSDFCIRIYNPSSTTYKTLATAYTKESSAGACASIPASALAQADAYVAVPNGGVVTTLAGSGSYSTVDGTGTAASFASPEGIAVDSAGNVYVADAGSNNYMIRKVTSGGVVTTLAGSTTNGSANGTGAAASFNFPIGAAVDSAGNVYVADTLNDLIRKITPAGVVTTLAGTGSYGSANGTGTAASFTSPYGLSVDSAGNLYVADQGNNLIRKITSAGVVTTLAGSGSAGYADGTGTAASFNFPSSTAVDSAGNVYVADVSNQCIRKITPAGVVTTFAGSTSGSSGSSNGTGTAASFSYPYGVAVDSSSNVYVADTGNNLIRKITSAGVVTTLAGSGSSGSSNGTGTAASFNSPNYVAVDYTGAVYITDSSNNLIRKIQ